ncbi:MAG TPA: glycosyltransferase [Thermoanaerobaculia bacterium]|nr:glycosyltransferase [Thermoanaerobaculia bacterium]
MDLSVVFVHYHTPGLLAEALAALTADLAASGLTAQWIVVDNGSDEAGRHLLAELPVQLLRPERNLGYAGGVRLARKVARAPVLLLANPDVAVFPGCVERLLAALAAGADAAGPRMYLDPQRRLLLPPTEERTLRGELLTQLAQRGDGWARRGRRRFRRHARRHWAAREPFASTALNGALLAIRSGAWDRTGGFDAGFPLYFEETDWLLRLARHGGAAVYVPAAEALHWYNQSAMQEASADAWFSVSAARFRRRHYGRLAPRLLSLAAGTRAGDGTDDPPLLAATGPPRLELAPHGRGGELWVELSPNRSGFPAAAERLPAGAAAWQLPRAVWERLAAGAYFLQLVTGDGEELGRWRVERPPPPQAMGRRGGTP